MPQAIRTQAPVNLAPGAKKPVEAKILTREAAEKLKAQGMATDGYRPGPTKVPSGLGLGNSEACRVPGHLLPRVEVGADGQKIQAPVGVVERLQQWWAGQH